MPRPEPTRLAGTLTISGRVASIAVVLAIAFLTIACVPLNRDVKHTTTGGAMSPPGEHRTETPRDVGEPAAASPAGDPGQEIAHFGGRGPAGHGSVLQIDAGLHDPGKGPRRGILSPVAPPSSVVSAEPLVPALLDPFVPSSAPSVALSPTGRS